ncbi:MAG: hypothetical protein ACKOCH_26950, partial [Bacteroidota bacterium]
SFPFDEKMKAEMSAVSSTDRQQSVATGRKPIPDQGALASVASSILMKVYGSMPTDPRYEPC